MNDLQLAHARGRGYTLLSGFFAHGLTLELAPFLQNAETAAPTCFDTDAAAAAHFQVMGRTIFAAQSFFLSPNGQRGGDDVEDLLVAYARSGFAPPPALESDGLACELAALAHLCAAEAQCWEDHLITAANNARVLQACFLSEHLLRWLPVLCEVLLRQPLPAYGRGTALLLGLVEEHVTHLGARVAAPAPAPLLHAPDPTAANTRLHDIADWLLAPACTGFLITRDDLQAAAALAALPYGFVDRRTMLIDLLRAAGEYNALPAFLAALETRAVQAATTYAAQAADAPGLAPWVERWPEQVAQTAGLLTAMQTITAA